MYLDPFYKMPNPIELLLSKSKVVIEGSKWKLYIDSIVFEESNVKTPVEFRELYLTLQVNPRLHLVRLLEISS
jgi:hypothetical protein